ncbi:MAG TPA: DUF5009 domain-containing protein [Acidisarcina sp.]
MMTATFKFSDQTRDEPARRLLSLDVFRGATIAAMILVNNPGTYDAVYSPLSHAEWHGATPTDMIFPSFLFIVGVVIPLALEARIERGATKAALAWRVLRRGAIIFILGLFMNGFPGYEWHTLRLPGVFQRIAICYLCAASLYLVTAGSRAAGEHSRASMQWMTFGGLSCLLLAGYWALLKLYPVPGIGPGHLDSYGNAPAYLDRALIGTRHMWAYGLTPGMGVTYDPEGILSTFPSLVNTFVGVLTGEWLGTRRSGPRKALGMAIAGAALLLAGWLLHPFLPLNKRIWTSTFALFSSGVSMLLFAIVYVLVDLRGSRWWTAPAMVFGTNALLAYILSELLASLGDQRIRLHRAGGASVITVHHSAYQHLFASWLSPINASLAYAIAVVLLCMALIYPLYRRRIYLRV